MKLNEIYLTNENSDKLADIVEDYNKDREPQDKISFQEMAEVLLVEMIKSEWYKVKK